MGGKRAAWAAALLLAASGVASGHFHTFWPDGPNGYGRRGRPVRWQYFWGHPYEMVLFDAREPSFYVVTPEGDREPVRAEPTTTDDPATGEPRRTYRLSYTPEELGDCWLVLEAPPYPIAEEGEAVRDYVKQCIHVTAEKGWDRPLGLPVELVPLTRPYGLEAGFAFTARAYLDGEPLGGRSVEIEKFNGFHVPADALPKDRFGREDVPMITRTARTDERGYLTCTLDEPGWWMVCVSAEPALAEGEELPVVLRGGLWVHVEDKFTQAPPSGPALAEGAGD